MKELTTYLNFYLDRLFLSVNYTRYVSSVSTNAFPSAAQGCWGETRGPESVSVRCP